MLLLSSGYFRCNAKFLWKRLPDEIKTVSVKNIPMCYNVQRTEVSCVFEYLVSKCFCWDFFRGIYTGDSLSDDLHIAREITPTVLFDVVRYRSV